MGGGLPIDRRAQRKGSPLSPPRSRSGRGAAGSEALPARDRPSADSAPPPPPPAAQHVIASPKDPRPLHGPEDRPRPRRRRSARCPASPPRRSGRLSAVARLPQLEALANRAPDPCMASAIGTSSTPRFFDEVQHRAPGRARPEARQLRHELDQPLDAHPRPQPPAPPIFRRKIGSLRINPGKPHSRRQAQLLADAGSSPAASSPARGSARP